MFWTQLVSVFGTVTSVAIVVTGVVLVAVLAWEAYKALSRRHFFDLTHPWSNGTVPRMREEAYRRAESVLARRNREVASARTARDSAQAAFDTADEAWVTGGSPAAGPLFDARNTANTALGSAQGTLTARETAQQTAQDEFDRADAALNPRQTGAGIGLLAALGLVLLLLITWLWYRYGTDAGVSRADTSIALHRMVGNAMEVSTPGFDADKDGDRFEVTFPFAALRPDAQKDFRKEVGVANTEWNDANPDQERTIKKLDSVTMIGYVSTGQLTCVTVACRGTEKVDGALAAKEFQYQNPGQYAKMSLAKVRNLATATALDLDALNRSTGGGAPSLPRLGRMQTTRN